MVPKTSTSDLSIRRPEYSAWYYNETEVNLTMIEANSRCVAADRYAWGFSASLILTFCFYTIIFAVSLAILQTEVYWNSRSDRVGREQSLYGDIIFLVRGLKALLGNDIENISVKLLNERIKRDKRGFRLEVDNLPTTRHKQWLIDNPPPSTLRVYRKGMLRDIYPEEKETVADRLTSWKRRHGHQRAAQSGSLDNNEQDTSHELSSLPLQEGEEISSASQISFVSRDTLDGRDTDSISVLQTIASIDITTTPESVRSAVRERTAIHSRDS